MAKAIAASKRPKYVALLRGINVGGNKKVEMATLRKAFEDLGYTNVSTYINSGNVIFESGSKDFAHLEKALEAVFGFELALIVRDAKTIRKIAAAIPEEWHNNAAMKTDILFLWKGFDSARTIDLLGLNPKVDTVRYISGALVWHLQRTHYAKSGMHKFIGPTVYKNMTARNVNTVRKLAALLG